VRLHRGQFGRLPLRHDLSAVVAREGLHHGGRRADQQRDGESAAMERIGIVEQEEKSVDSRHRESGGGVRGERHVQRLLKGHRVEHAGDRIDVEDPTVHQLEPRRGIHPGIGRHDEDPGCGTAHRHQYAREQVRPRRNPVPPVEIDAEEDGLGEERETFE
jgi:hypothetical protein